jgi:hypothetical protein
MVGYHPNALLEKDLRAGLDDEFERVAVHPITKMPDIYNRHSDKVIEFVQISLPDRQIYRTEMSQMRASIALAVQLAPEVVRFMIEETRQYGMNRIDWFTLITILDQAGVPLFS